MPQPPEAPSDLAPRWHTAALITLILLVAGMGALLTHLAAPAVSTAAGAAAGNGATPGSAAMGSRITTIYLPVIVVQWALVVYVCRIGRAKNALFTLLGERWRTWGRAGLDLVLAGVGWLLIKAFELAWARLFSVGSSAAVVAMLPQSWPERLTWVILALTVGFGEEVVYRGYLQTQLTAFTGRAGVALLLQAVLFGIAHGEQGPGAVLRACLYGLAFGALARWRRSLLPGIACHAWTDLVSGLVHG